MCRLEIELAVKHNKRLAPVVWKDANSVHEAMSAHNWVFLRQEDDFKPNFELLIDPWIPIWLISENIPHY